jgi:phosphoglycolate phosphatase
VASLPASEANPAQRFPLQVGAIALDLDGTLVDTLPDLHEAGNRMLGGLGLEPALVTQVRAFIGDGVDRLIKRLLTGLPDAEPDAALFGRARESFTTHYAQVLTRESRPYPGVKEALDEMRRRGFRLACVTNKPEAFTQPLLRELGLAARLDLVLGGDSLPRKKPDPLPLVHTARVFGLEPGRVLMIGDSANDCLAARAAGSPVFCVPYGYRGSLGVHELDCDAIVPTLSEALELITFSQS